MTKLCEKIGLRRITWHVLRHTFASHLAQKGVPVKAIQELLGHSDIKMTMRYAHFSQSSLREAIKNLESDENIVSFGQPVGNTSEIEPISTPKTQNERPYFTAKVSKNRALTLS